MGFLPTGRVEQRDAVKLHLVEVNFLKLCPTRGTKGESISAPAATMLAVLKVEDRIRKSMHMDMILKKHN